MTISHNRQFMINSPTKSRSTNRSALQQSRFSQSLAHSQFSHRHPYIENLPNRFPKNHIVKSCAQNMLTTTIQNPQISSIRIFQKHNRSSCFEGPNRLAATTTRHPSTIFYDEKERKLANPGVFNHLARESDHFPIRLRTYQDIGIAKNEKRMLTKVFMKPDPIIVGQKETNFNSSFDKNWKQPRRHRDNGIECHKTMQWSDKKQRRDPYCKPEASSYKQMYINRNSKK